MPRILTILVFFALLAACDDAPDSSDGADSVEQWLDDRGQPVETIDDLEPVVDAAGDHRLVLLGEATHGTEEFYDWRADLTLEIAETHGLDFIAVEADWHSARAADRWVMGKNETEDVDEMLVEAFDRWGEDWMWANEHFADLLERIRQFNRAHPDRPIRVYGIDMHGFFDSLERLVDRLEAEHPDRADDIVDALSCLGEYSPRPNRYSRHIQAGDDNCKAETERAVEEIRRLYDSDDTHDLSTRQHARVVAAGEAQYRRRITGGPNDFWNIRATHMADITRALARFHGEESRGAVWAHNTHVGDARATDMTATNRVNIGQLARESMGDDAVFAFGFSSARGEVLAAPRQGVPPRVMELPEAVEGSLDEILSRHQNSRYMLTFNDDDHRLPTWQDNPGHRAVGVTYHPDREVPGNYVPTNPARRYEALLFIDQTTPLRPLQ